MIIEAILGIGLCYCWYLYTRSVKYRIGNFPTPPHYFLLGHAPYVNSAEKILPYLAKYLSKYHGIMKIYLGSEVVLAISDHKCVEWLLSSTSMISKSRQYSFFSDWLGKALLISSGPHWKSRRKIMTPAFHFKRVENLISVCQSAGKIFVQQMAKNLGKDCFDAYPIVSKYALDVVCVSSMAVSINAQETNSEYGQSILILCDILLERMFHIIYMNDFLFPFHPQYKTYKKSLKTIHDFDESVIARRRKLLQDREKEESVDGYGEHRSTPFLDVLLRAKDDKGNVLSDADIRDEVDGIMFGGQETIAAAVSFVLYHLSIHPDVQEKVYNEQKDILSRNSKSEITNIDLNEMKYLEMVIKETLRLFTPIPFIGRKLQEDVYFDGKLLPKNTTIMILLHNLHRNPEVFPDPEKFDPTRFDASSKIPNFAYLPFSAGLRNCIGQKFAMFEIKVAVTELVKHFVFLPAANYKPKVNSQIALKSSNGVYLKIKKREESISEY